MCLVSFHKKVCVRAALGKRPILSGQRSSHLEQANQRPKHCLHVAAVTRPSQKGHTGRVTKFEVAVFFANEQFVDHLRGVRCEGSWVVARLSKRRQGATEVADFFIATLSSRFHDEVDEMKVCGDL